MPAAFGEAAAAPNHPEDQWQRGTWTRGRIEYARDAAGHERRLRIWNSRTEAYTITPGGRSYYRHNRIEFIVELPAVPRMTRVNRHTNVPHIITPNGWDGRMIPLDEDTVYNAAWFTGGYAPIAPIMGVGRVRDHPEQFTPEAYQHAIRAAVMEWLAHQRRDDEGHVILAHESGDIYWVWDEDDEITFSERVVRHIRSDGVPIIENLLHRPLLGVPVMNEYFYRRLGLAPGACENMAEKGGCVLTQLLQITRSVQKNKRGPRVQQPDGRVTRSNNSEQVQVPLFSKDKLIEMLNQAQAAAYPVGHWKEGEEVPGQDAPYTEANWDTVGVTTSMMREFAVIAGVIVTVIYRRYLLGRFEPLNVSHSTPVVCFAMWGDHAFFYDDAATKWGGAQLAKAAVVLHLDKVHSRLRSHLDEDDQVDFAVDSWVSIFNRQRMVPRSIVLQSLWDSDGGVDQLEGLDFVARPSLDGNVLREFIIQCPDGSTSVLKVRKNSSMAMAWDPEMFKRLRLCAPKSPLTFWAYTKDTKEVSEVVQKLSEELGFAYGHLSTPTLNVCRGFSIENAGPKPSKLRFITDIASELQKWCIRFEELTGFRLPYKGEGLSVLTHRAFNEVLVCRRRIISDDVRLQVASAQQFKCMHCGDALKRFDIDHKKALCQGGSNDLDNLQALCRPCHSRKTEEEQVLAVSQTLVSELSPSMLEQFHKCPKPAEISWSLLQLFGHLRGAKKAMLKFAQAKRPGVPLLQLLSDSEMRNELNRLIADINDGKDKKNQVKFKALTVPEAEAALTIIASGLPPKGTTPKRKQRYYEREPTAEELAERAADHALIREQWIEDGWSEQEIADDLQLADQFWRRFTLRQERIAKRREKESPNPQPRAEAYFEQLKQLWSERGQTEDELLDHLQACDQLQQEARRKDRLAEDRDVDPERIARLIAAKKKRDAANAEERKVTYPVVMTAYKKSVMGLDVRGCRLNALKESSFPLPVFALTDEPKAVKFDSMEAAVEASKTSDFLYISQDKVGEFPCSGSRWYWKEAVLYMLDAGLIAPTQLKAALLASRHISPTQFRVAADAITATWDAWSFGPELGEGLKKRSLLAMFGLWNSGEQKSWKRVVSSSEFDAGGGAEKRRYIGDGLFEFDVPTHILDNRCLSPLGRIALDMEQVRVHQGMRMLQKRSPVDLFIVAAHVDEIYFVHTERITAEQLKTELLSEHTYPSGAPVFQIKYKNAKDVPHWPQKETIDFPLQVEEIDWVKVLDPEIEQTVDLVLKHGGGAILGPAGTGKSTLMRALQERIRLREPWTAQYMTGIRHSTVAMSGGKTLAHLMHRFDGTPRGAPREGTVVGLDEVSEVSLGTWSQLARWQLMGVRFVAVGDFAGQMPPVFDRWADAMKLNDIQQSEFLKRLCGNLQICLTICRRSADDEPHFRFYASLYPFVDKPKVVSEQVARAVAEYKPLDSSVSSAYICISHKKRVKLNAWANAKEAADGRAVVFIKCGDLELEANSTMVPQDMHVFVGQHLIGCDRACRKNGVVNGVVYVVLSFTDSEVLIERHKDYCTKAAVEEDPLRAAADRMLDPEPAPEAELSEGEVEEDEDGAEVTSSNKRLVLTHEQVWRKLRLMNASCYASVCGRTLRDMHVTLLDVSHCRFTLRHLIVGLSRVTAGSYMHVLSEDADDELMGRVAGRSMPAARSHVQGRCWVSDEADAFDGELEW